MISKEERKLILQWDQKKKSQQEIAQLLGCHQSSVSRFLLKYNRKGVIDNLPRSGRPTKLTPKNLFILKKKILSFINTANPQYCAVSTKQVKEIINKEIGKLYTLRHVERIMYKLHFSLITPRPEHIRHDQKKVDEFRDEFKKNLNRSMWVMS